MLVAHLLVGKHGILAVEGVQEAVGVFVKNDGNGTVVGHVVGEEQVVVEGNGSVFNAHFAAVGAGLVNAVGQMAIDVAAGHDVDGGDGFLFFVDMQFHGDFLYFLAAVVVDTGNQGYRVVHLEDGTQEPAAVNGDIAELFGGNRDEADMRRRIGAQDGQIEVVLLEIGEIVVDDVLLFGGLQRVLLKSVYLFERMAVGRYFNLVK